MINFAFFKQFDQSKYARKNYEIKACILQRELNENRAIVQSEYIEEIRKQREII